MKNILAGATALAVALTLSLAAAMPASAEGDPTDPANSAPPSVVADTPTAPVADQPAAPPAADPAPAAADPAPAPAAEPPAAEPAPAPAAAAPATDPVATDPAATDPAATDPTATNPAATDPAAADPAAASTVQDTTTNHGQESDDHLIEVYGNAEATDQMCRHGDLIDGRITVDITTGVKYEITNSDHEVIWFDSESGKTRRLDSGKYKVEVSAEHGYLLKSDDTIWLRVHSQHGDCGNDHHPTKVTGGASSTAQICVDGVLVGGRITVDITEGVDYQITNSDHQAIPFDAGSGQTATLPNGSYTVSVSAEHGYKLKSADKIWVTIAAFTGPCLLVTPTLSSAGITCTAPGSYTLNALEGVVWNVNGAVVPAGTYSVSTTQTVNVLATTSSADIGFEANAQTTWQLSFAAATDCVHVTVLPTLASTGVQGGGVGMTVLSGLLFLLGGAGVYTVSKVRSRNRS